MNAKFQEQTLNNLTNQVSEQENYVSVFELLHSLHNFELF